MPTASAGARSAFSARSAYSAYPLPTSSIKFLPDQSPRLKCELHLALQIASITESLKDKRRRKNLLAHSLLNRYNLYAAQHVVVSSLSEVNL